MEESRNERNKKRSLQWNIQNICLIGFFFIIMYFIGFSQGQASVYEKQKADRLENMYKVEIKSGD
jgi:hypothetical protein